MGKIADILQARGDLDEALRILREDVLPVFERLGDMREKAVTMGKIADILRARGDLDEVLRILRKDVLPVYERLGDVRNLYVGLANYAQMLLAAPTRDRVMEARECLRRSVTIADRLGLPFPDELRELLAKLEELPVA